MSWEDDVVPWELAEEEEFPEHVPVHKVLLYVATAILVAVLIVLVSFVALAAATLLGWV